MKKLSVLIVDDSSVIRKIVERTVRQTGIPVEKVMEAENGMVALDLLQTQEPDLVFSDINMPQMDGLEFLRRLHGSGLISKVRVLMITTEGSETKVLEAISLGARGYIRKPFSLDEVKEQINNVLHAE